MVNVAVVILIVVLLIVVAAVIAVVVVTQMKKKKAAPAVAPPAPTASPTAAPSSTAPSSSTAPAPSSAPIETQVVHSNNGTVSCSTFCAGLDGKPWNNELPAEWNGAECVSGSLNGAPIGCDSAPGAAVECTCKRTGSGWATTPAPAPAPTPAPGSKPRAADSSDCGYPNRPRGWYDIQGQGVRNDFCRFVGNWPGWFSCKLAGSTAEMTAQGTYPDAKGNDAHDPYTGGFTGHNC